MRPSWAWRANIGNTLRPVISRARTTAAYFRGSAGYGLPMRFPGVSFQVLVHVVDHDDRGVHHDADGYGDPPERHDVGVNTQGIHDQERHQDAQAD